MNEKVESIVELAPFNPTPSQKKAKAAYWGRARSDDLVPKTGITLAVAVDITGSTSLRKWWSDPGFKDWFTNGEEWRQRAESLMDLAMDRAEAILKSDDPKLVNAQAKLIDWLTVITDRMPVKYKEIKVLDQEVGKLKSPEEIRAWLAAKGIHLLPGGVNGSKQEGPTTDNSGSKPEI